MRLGDLKGMIIMGMTALFLAGGSIPAQAIPIEVNFKIKNFSLSSTPSSTTPPPDNRVKGTIIYEADSVTADIISLTSIDLTIDGYTYSISEVGYVSPFSVSRQQIGGDLVGPDFVGSLAVGTDDFRLDWFKYTLIPIKFSYTSSSHGGIWDSNTFSSFKVRASEAVPEPATLLLLGSGLIGLAGLRRKIKK